MGDEESTTWKLSRLQGVGLMGMPADDPLVLLYRGSSYKFGLVIQSETERDILFVIL